MPIPVDPHWMDLGPRPPGFSVPPMDNPGDETKPDNPLGKPVPDGTRRDGIQAIADALMARRRR